MQGDDDDAKAILKRRARYVAMALAGIGTATQATACICLEPPGDLVDVGFPPDEGLDASNAEDARTPGDAAGDADEDAP